MSEPKYKVGDKALGYLSGNEVEIIEILGMYKVRYKNGSVIRLQENELKDLPKLSYRTAYAATDGGIMIEDCKIRSGYRVSGRNTADGRLSLWYFPTEEQANTFAKELAKTTKQEVDVLLYLGSWRPAEQPIEFIPATKEKDNEAD